MDWENLLCIESLDCVDRESRRNGGNTGICVCGILVQAAAASLAVVSFLSMDPVVWYTPWVRVGGLGDVAQEDGATARSSAGRAGTTSTTNGDHLVGASTQQQVQTTKTTNGKLPNLHPLTLCISSAAVNACVVYLHVLRNVRIKKERGVRQKAERFVRKHEAETEHASGTGYHIGKQEDQNHFYHVVAQESMNEQPEHGQGATAKKTTPADPDAEDHDDFRKSTSWRTFLRIFSGSLVGAFVFCFLLDPNVPFGYVALSFVTAGCGCFGYLQAVPGAANALSEGVSSSMNELEAAHQDGMRGDRERRMEVEMI
ncbi:unnamed protein product [Amoebophrya sp. A25]|nr:unnamed protein product [Amoebophrya sp. A25]|eukprot:GSA25T00010138001.1